MDRWTRNLRLYETLKGMGLFVSPIPETDDPTKIRYMIVAVDLPAPEGASSDDGQRKARPTAAGSGGKVIDFRSAS